MFGLKNVSTTFHRAMNDILASVKLQHAIVYTNDIIVFSKTKAKHKLLEAKVMLLLKNTGIVVILKKCSLSSDAIDKLGHVNAAGSLQIAKKTTDKVKLLQYSSTVSGMRFLGLCCKYSRFVQNFARLALFPNQKPKKGVL